MTKSLSRPLMLLIEALAGVWLRSRNHTAGTGLVDRYEPRLGIVKASAMHRNLTRLRLLYRSPAGEPWPDEVKKRLDDLEGAINKVALAPNEHEDRTRTQDALIKWQNAFDTFGEHGLRVPELLGPIRTALEQARNELDPNQEPGRPR